MHMRHRPYFFASLFFLFCFVLSFVVFYRLFWQWNLIISWNVATFLLYGFDKWQAGGKRLRVPEIIFYFVTFLGGSVGTLFGLHVFHHKTRKTSFQIVVAILLLIQVALVVSLIDRSTLSFGS